MKHRLYQPYFFMPLTIFLAIWGISLTFRNQLIEFSVIALITIILATLSSFLVFAFWRYTKYEGVFLLIGTTIIAVLGVPVFWILTHGIILKVYAYTVTSCCETSWMLNVTIWHVLSELLEQSTTHLFFWSLYFYASVSLLKVYRNQVYLRIYSGIVSLIAGGFTVMGVVACGQQIFL